MSLPSPTNVNRYAVNIRDLLDLAGVPAGTVHTVYIQSPPGTPVGSGAETLVFTVAT